MQLTYLDAMPVFEDERRTSEAWGRGGLEEEKKERETIRKEVKDRERRNYLAFENMISEAKQKRARQTGSELTPVVDQLIELDINKQDSTSVPVKEQEQQETEVTTEVNDADENDGYKSAEKGEDIENEESSIMYELD